MKMAEALLPEFEQEAANTRKTLDRIPDGKMDWAPHAKSMPLGKLANHLADLPGWTVITFDRDVLDIGEYKIPQFETRAEILAAFDEKAASARKALAEVSDEVAQGNWSLAGGGQTYFTMPKMAVIRTWVLNHSVHHRAQLGVYLRLLDIPVPGVYGPSADEM